MRGWVAAAILLGACSDASRGRGTGGEDAAGGAAPADVGRPDDPGDLGVAEADAGPDGSIPDARGPDLRVPDARVPDAQAPEPDAQGPDAFVPDARAPDGHAPDAFAPDAEVPDASPPDMAAPPGPGTHFASPPRRWRVPEGGHPEAGFHSLAGLSFVPDGHTWAVTDLDGDRRADLVVTAQLVGGTQTAFGAPGARVWHLHRNQGDGFSLESTPWSLPDGGAPGGGFWNLVGSADAGGGQTWHLTDLDGDGLADLVVTAVSRDGRQVTPGEAGQRHWQLFRNTGAGFARAADAWAVPEGGRPGAGFWTLADSSQEETGQTWALTDLDGDRRADLVVTGTDVDRLQRAFGRDGERHWQLFRNEGDGFARMPAAWPVPDGGQPEQGFWSVAGSGQVDGGQTWTLLDLHGDGTADLVVTSQRQGERQSVFTDAGGDGHWRVYRSSGAGFARVPETWAVPAGGHPDAGYWVVSGTSRAEGGEIWAATDLAGDGRPDLVVTGQREAGVHRAFGAAGRRSWRVFENTGAAFAEQPADWGLPDGGQGDGSFPTLAGANALDLDDQVWSLADFDGDGRGDLAVTGHLAAAPGGDRVVNRGFPGPAWYWDVFFNRP